MRAIVIILMVVLLATGCSKRHEDKSLQNQVESTDSQENVDNQVINDEQSGLSDHNPLKEQEEVVEQKKKLIEDTLNEIDSINELLAKSAKGVNNVVASLFGLSEMLESVNEISQKAIDNGEAAKNLINDCKDHEKLYLYYYTIYDYNNQLKENKELVKQAKKDQNIEKLKEELNNLYKLIENYNQYLMEVNRS